MYDGMNARVVVSSALVELSPKRLTFLIYLLYEFSSLGWSQVSCFGMVMFSGARMHSRLRLSESDAFRGTINSFYSSILLTLIGLGVANNCP